MDISTSLSDNWLFIPQKQLSNLDSGMIMVTLHAGKADQVERNEKAGSCLLLKSSIPN
jgi:hypothetical protein